MPLTSAQEIALIEAVRSTAKDLILPRFRRLDGSAISTKSRADDLVTIADQETEIALTALIPGILPGALVIGEEASAEDPGLPARVADAPLAVIIDPIDGTWNFAAGIATFGLILAVAEDGDTVFGLHYDPVLDDWVLARKGGGTWYCAPGMDPLQLSFDSPAAEGLPGIAPVSIYSEPIKQPLMQSLMGLGRIDNYHCSCHEYRTLAFGKARFVLTYKPKPWDHAAGALICQEAGGVVKRLDGTPYRPGLMDLPVINARDEATWNAVQSQLAWLLEEPNF